MGYTGGTITNISAYQYSASGKQSGDTETPHLASGLDRVGGTIGQYSGSSWYLTTSVTTNSIIKGRNYIGGNVGLTSGGINNLTSTNNTVIASNQCAGGNIGYQSSWTNRNLTATNNTVTATNYYAGGNIGYVTGRAGTYNLTSTNNKVNGGSHVGGNVGRFAYYTVVPYTLKVEGANTKIVGQNYVGGSVGYSNVRMRGVQVSDAELIKGTGSYVGGIVGCQVYTTTSISATSYGNYSIASAKAKGLTIEGNSSYVGGIAGYSLGTIGGAVVEDCSITATGDNAGGIAGYYAGYNGTSGSYVSASTFFLWHSYCFNSTVKANNNAGGLVRKL